MDTMTDLEALIARLPARNPYFPLHTWTGKVAPEWESPAHEIVATSGYPYPRQRDGRPVEFTRLDAAAAARLLAQVATQSLAYEFPRAPDEALTQEIIMAFAALGESASFLTNMSAYDRGWSWFPLSDATFDAGVIAFNDKHGFIYWVEDED